jgi:hypothetical protein
MNILAMEHTQKQLDENKEQEEKTQRTLKAYGDYTAKGEYLDVRHMGQKLFNESTHELKDTDGRL